MALTFTNETLRGIDQEVLVVEAGVVIPKGSLTKWDIDVLTKVEATEGADFKTKLQAYVMPNTKTAYAYYTPYLIAVDEYNSTWVDSDVADIAKTVAKHSTQLADLEDRVTSLEAPEGP